MKAVMKSTGKKGLHTDLEATPKVTHQRSLRIIAVFEKGDNLVWRILANGSNARRAQLTVEAPVRSKAKEKAALTARAEEGSDVKAADTASLDATPISPIYIGYVGWPKNAKPSSPTEAVFSLELPRDILSFTVYWANNGGATTASMTPDFARALFSIRDARMINPEIDPSYPQWQALHNLPINPFQEGPLFSLVIPVFKPKELHLRELLESVLMQTYKKWELVLVDASPEDGILRSLLKDFRAQIEKDCLGCRVKVVTLEKNEGIAPNTNAGIAVATGDYICFADHDDLLSPNLLAAYARTIKSAEPRNVDLLFCDEDNFEDRLEDGFTAKPKKGVAPYQFIAPRIKPSFNRGLLLSHNYVVHCLCLRREFLETLELSSDEMSGAQDYDLTLKAFEKGAEVIRVPAVLYHWRVHPGSTNGGKVDQKPYATKAGQRALVQHLARMAEDATVEIGKNPATYVVCWKPLPKTTPVIYVELGGPTFTNEIWAERLLAAVEGRVAQAHLAEEEKKTAILVVNATGTAAMDVQQQRELASTLRRKDLGMVAPRLFYPDSLLQYSGTVIADDGSLVSINQNFADAMGGGYHGLSELGADYSCLTSPIFAISLQTFKQVEKEWRTISKTLSVQADSLITAPSCAPFSSLPSPLSAFFSPSSCPQVSPSLSAFVEKLQIAALSFAVRKQGYSVGVSPLVSVVSEGPVKTSFLEKGDVEEESIAQQALSFALPFVFSAQERKQRKILKEKKKLLKAFWKYVPVFQREDVQDLEGVTFTYGYPQLDTWLQLPVKKRLALFVRCLQGNLYNLLGSRS